MAQPITLPKLGQMVEESTITRWLKQEGDLVKKGDLLFEMETDKSVMEVESFFEGTLIKILVPAGHTVPVMETVAYIGNSGETISEVPSVHSLPSLSIAKPQHHGKQELHSPSNEPEGQQAALASDRSDQDGSSSLRQPTPDEKTNSAFRISPRAARLAREAGIDPACLVGTGPENRIVERDVQAYVAAQAEKRAGLLSRGREEPDRDAAAAPGANVSGGEPPVAMTRMRQVIAQRLSESYRTAPHFFVTVSVDMTDLVALKRECQNRRVAYSFNDFILKSVALTLSEYPILNSTTDGKQVWHHRSVNLGLAVSLEHGLVVPVLRGVSELSLQEIHDQASALISKARAGKLQPAEMTGSTFTVSNMGMFDVENFTAIINPGESAILAVSSITEQAVVRNHTILVRDLMKMTLSCDHRLIDGALAGRFMNAVKQRLEDASLWQTLT